MVIDVYIFFNIKFTLQFEFFFSRKKILRTKFAEKKRKRFRFYEIMKINRKILPKEDSRYGYFIYLASYSNLGVF